jgi:hypothetical protein
VKPLGPPHLSQLAGTVTRFLRRSDHGCGTLTGQPRQRNSGNADPAGVRAERSGAEHGAHTTPRTPAPDAQRPDRRHESDHPPDSGPTDTARDRTPPPKAPLTAHASRDSRGERQAPPTPEDSRRPPRGHAVLTQAPRLTTKGVTRGRDHATTHRALPTLHRRDTSRIRQTMKVLIPHAPHPSRNSNDAGIAHARGHVDHD